MKPALASVYVTAEDILAQAGGSLPASMAALQEHIARMGWRDDPRRCRRQPGSGGGYEYDVALLPSDVRARLLLALEAEGRAAAPAPGPSNAVWAAFERLPETTRAKAAERLRAVDAVAAYEAHLSRSDAVSRVSAEFGMGASSLWEWLALVDGVARPDRLPALAPRYAGRTATADCDPRLWDVLVADYLRPEERSFAGAHRTMLRVAAANPDWGPIPSAKTLQRRLEREFPRVVRTLARGGRDAVERIFPHQTRDRAVFHAMQAIVADGYRHNVFVEGPDGARWRPITVALMDLHSGKIVAWRTDRTENRDVVRLAFADLVERWGVPERAYLDNGRAFASKWMTGGMATRFRFKVRDEEPSGILTSLGVQVHWATPHHGQAKPIERAFRDWGDDVDKHPRLAGAYTGRSPLAKPDNYGDRAIALDVFLEVLAAEVQAHNARPGRRGGVCRGRSFDQVFEESRADPGALIRRATDAQRRMFLLAAEGVACRAPTGEVQLAGNRYHHEALYDHVGRKLVVRFDPQALHAGVAVYTLDGRFIADAPAIAATGFDDTQAAREHARAKKDFVRATQAALAAERRLTIQEVAALLPGSAPEAERPKSKAVRLVANGRPVRRDPDDAADAFGRGVALMSEPEVLPFRPNVGCGPNVGRGPRRDDD